MGGGGGGGEEYFAGYVSIPQGEREEDSLTNWGVIATMRTCRTFCRCMRILRFSSMT